MRLPSDPRLGRDATASTFMPALLTAWRTLTAKVNGIAAGNIEDAEDTATASPTMAATVGKFVRNSAPTELGSVSSKYVVLGWVCTASGDPATFKECRCPTGN